MRAALIAPMETPAIQLGRTHHDTTWALLKKPRSSPTVPQLFELRMGGGRLLLQEPAMANDVALAGQGVTFEIGATEATSSRVVNSPSSVSLSMSFFITSCSLTPNCLLGYLLLPHDVHSLQERA